MATIRKNPQKALVESLKVAKKASRGGIVKSSKLARKHREILTNAGFLSEIIKGWYLLTSPEGGGSAAWYSGFWPFVKLYLTERFGEEGFCLSANSSLNIHAGDTSIPKQIVVLTKKASNKPVRLPHDTSLLLIMDSKNFPEEIEEWSGLRIMSLPLALCRITPGYYRNNPQNIEIVLRLSVLSVAAISRGVLRAEAIPAAERIIGAYEHFGEITKSDQVKKDLVEAGYHLAEKNPFEEYEPKLGTSRPISPYAGRIRMMWGSMRDVVLAIMPHEPGLKNDLEQIKENVKEIYKEDAYHSLSIEGYQVTEELIAKIESGDWDPASSETDRRHKDALAAKGYQTAFKTVLSDVSLVLEGSKPGQVFEDGLHGWYRSLFSPSVKASILSPETLAGYRNIPVYIRSSRHVPPPYSAVPDCMETLFDLLKKEESGAVRAVLGHLVFVFIHPYMDGNGRIGRFLMNLMLVSGGYNWTVIKVEGRDQYMDSLEEASTRANIEPFVEFIKKQMRFD